MPAAVQTKPVRAEREVTITRVFDAPRALVFKAWTDPKHLAKWWGPQGYTNPVCEFDARVGGVIRIHMKSRCAAKSAKSSRRNGLSSPISG
jgi:uncharacterized protein YndB with AHSA1/START domain